MQKQFALMSPNNQPCYGHQGRTAQSKAGQSKYAESGRQIIPGQDGENMKHEDYGYDKFEKMHYHRINGVIGWGDTPETAKKQCIDNLEWVEEKESKQINDQFI